jgi:hypothetical protein
MGIETFRSAGPSSPTRNGVSAGTWDSAPTRHSGRTRNASVPPPKARTPDSFQVTTQLMEDAIPWGGLPVRSGRNQKALFANPFKEDAEEALLIGDGGLLYYLHREENPALDRRGTTGWAVDLVQPVQRAAELVVAVLPNGSVWAVCLPWSRSTGWIFLRLEEAGEAGDEVVCEWKVQQNPVSPSLPPLSDCGLQLGYAPGAGPTVMGVVGTQGAYTAIFLSADLPQVGSGQKDEKWTCRTRSFAAPDLAGRAVVVAGGGYLPEFSTPPDSPHHTIYLWDSSANLLDRVDFGASGTSLKRMPTPGAFTFCGTWNVPALPHSDQQSDIGYVVLTPAGELQFRYVQGKDKNYNVLASTVTTPFAEASVWQDADGLMHVFGADRPPPSPDYVRTLYVLHQTGWEIPPTSVVSCGPTWATAVTEEGPETTVIVGVRSGIYSYALDPYPDYKPTALTEGSDTGLAEAYGLFTQDVTTDRWATEYIRVFPPLSDKDLVRVNRYCADVTLLNNVGAPMPEYPVIITADTLTEINVDTQSFQVGPGKSVSLPTNHFGRLCIGVNADDLNPPVVHVNCDGLEAGALIDFSSPVGNYLAGTSPLPSQTGPLSVEVLDHAQTTDTAGLTHDLMNDVWRQYSADAKAVFVDNIHNMYALAQGLTPKVTLDGYDEPQEVAGYVFQTWDTSRPAFQIFHTEEELAAYRAYRDGHPEYGGLWEQFADFAWDVWEGIKTGAARVKEFFVNTGEKFVEIAIKVGNYLISLGERVVETFEEAAQAVAAGFQMVADTVVRVVEWLKTLFSLSDVWDTKVALEKGLSNSIDMFESTLDHLPELASGWFAAQRETVDTVIDMLEQQYPDTRLGDFTNKAPAAQAPTGIGLNRQELSTPQANWFLNRIVALVGDLPITHEPSPFMERLADPLDDFFSSIVPSAAFGKFIEAFRNTAGELYELFTSLTPGSASGYEYVRLLELIREMLDDLLNALDAMVDSLLKFAKDAIAGSIKTLLKQPIPGGLGLVDDLYQWVWKQARPNETPQTVTLGGLIALIAAFPVTTVYKLANGVGDAPFPGGEFPDFPSPPWGPDSGAAVEWTSEDALYTQCTMLAHTVLAPFASVVSDLAVPWSAGVGKGQAWPWLGNILNGVTGVLGIIQSAPPVGGAPWDLASTSPWAVGIFRWAFDMVLAGGGPHWDKVDRSTLLKNVGFGWDKAGNALKKSDSIWIGAGVHLALGTIVCGLNSHNARNGRVSTNPTRWGLGVAGVSCGFIPDVLGFVRAFLQEAGPVSIWTAIGILAISGINGLVTLGGVLCARVPPYIERDHRPGFPVQTPDTAKVGEEYKWTITSTVATEPINERPASSPQRYTITFDPKDTSPFTADPVSGLISCAKVPPNPPPHVRVDVRGEDGYGPPLSASTYFLIGIQSADQEPPPDDS